MNKKYFVKVFKRKS